MKKGERKDGGKIDTGGHPLNSRSEKKRVKIKLSGRAQIHSELPRGSYVKFRIATFERHLTASDVVAGFATLIADRDEQAFRLLDRLAVLKYRGLLKEYIESGTMMDNVERNAIYEMLESSDKKVPG